MFASDTLRGLFMPNFSHGTAGVSYFLAELYHSTGDQRFLNVAIQGAEHLLAIANDSGLVYHHEPDGLDLFYLGWCHGPAGTARLFYTLYKLTGNDTWKDALLRSSEAVLACGIPTRQTPGFWNNVGQCCGSVGIARFYLGLHAAFGDKRFLDFSKALTNDVLRRASREDNGIKWIQAEHRKRPELLIAQTGFMQGSAGIGTWLLWLDAFENGNRVLIRLPDDPW
jgi:lantibiotic modifying enzyme